MWLDVSTEIAWKAAEGVRMAVDLPVKCDTAHLQPGWLVRAGVPGDRDMWKESRDIRKMGGTGNCKLVWCLFFLGH